MPTLAAWVGNLISLISTVLGYLSGTDTDDKLAMILQGLYDVHAEVNFVKTCVYRVVGETPKDVVGLLLNEGEALDEVHTAVVGSSSVLESVQDEVAVIDDNIGLYSEGQTVSGDLAAIYARIAPGEEPPPPIATTADTARILAALYYVAQSVVVPAWSVDNTEVLAAIETVDGKVDSNASAIAVNDNANTAIITGKIDDLETATGVIGEAVQAVAEAVAAFEPGGGGGAGMYPGLGLVTLGDTVNITGPTTIAGPMDGLLITVSSVPSGQSVTQTPNGARYKGLGWAVFMTGEGEGEQLQKIETQKCCLLPKSISTPASCEVFCKSGSALSVKPFTITA